MKKAEIIFNKFSTNLHNICKYFGFELEERFNEEAYICPLSFQIYDKKGLSSEFNDQLTVEHIPPEALKGKAMCLTNRISNSKSGQSLDIALQNHIKLREYSEKVSPLTTTAYLENVKLESTLDFTQKDNPKIIFKPKSNHQGIDRIIDKIDNAKNLNFRFTVYNNDRKTTISLLRTAYLYAFGFIGYSLIFGATKIVNPNYKLIRDQIANPDENIIGDLIILDKGIEDMSYGVNLVYEPKEFRSIFVVFPVITQNKEWKYGVFLPGPDDYGFDAMNKIKESIEKENFRFKYYNFPKLDITNLDDNKHYYEIWKKHNGIEKK